MKWTQVLLRLTLLIGVGSILTLLSVFYVRRSEIFSDTVPTRYLGLQVQSGFPLPFILVESWSDNPPGANVSFAAELALLDVVFYASVAGGYGCRSCARKSSCAAGCGGFDDMNWRLFKKDGWYVRVLPKRKSVFGTAWYQLNHASIQVGMRRSHCVTYVGVCAKRLYRSEVVENKPLCPICVF
jgi:hypothetical protein